MTPTSPKKLRSTRICSDTLHTTRPSHYEGHFSRTELRSNHATSDSFPKPYKRQVLAHLDENLALKHERRPQKSATPVIIPLGPTQADLLVLEEQCSIGTASFRSEVRSRILQEAGKDMGFNLKLDCYEQAPVSIKDWCESQMTLLEDRPILKDPQDLTDMAVIAKAFEADLVQDAHGSFQK